MKKYDAVVIGSGASGLTSAILFSKRGKKVALLEQSDHLAPLLSGFDRLGVHFETGFHYSGILGKDEAGGFLFDELGIDAPVRQCQKEDYDVAYLVDSKRSFRMPLGVQNWIEQLNEFFPHEKEGIKKYFDLVKQTIDATPFLNIHKRHYKNEEFFYFNADKKTLKEVLDECFKTDEIKSALSFSTSLYGTPPSKSSFFLHCCCGAIMYESAWKFVGGARSFVNACKKVLDRNGVDIFLSSKVNRISLKQDLKVLTLDNGQQLECDFCISSIHPKELIKIAPPEIYRQRNLDRIKNTAETPGFFISYAISKNPQKYNISNLAFLKSADFLNDHKDSMYINFSENLPQAVQFSMRVNSNSKQWDMPRDEYKKTKEQMMQKIKSIVNQYRPDIWENMNFVEQATPLTMKRYTNYYGAYGMMHSSNDAAIMPITKIPGLFLVGQAVVAPGLIGAMISAFLLDKMFGLRK
ncbi:MAG: NAD(P)/FAD-dependent oxidoreductase [Elusimicrobiota bacterium]|jgi:all-trans-retinol 13,14-reductase|nr:NAD(P)/FAD-dependent oxidoreductase [Elusimicrobiota bacterium]